MNSFKFYISIIVTILLFISCGQNSKEIVKKGAKIIGGCCETTPEHIREIAKLK